MLVKEMAISSRAKACLLNAGYVTIEDLHGITKEELGNIKNLNDTLIEDILKFLDENRSISRDTVSATPKRDEFMIQYRDVFERKDRFIPSEFYSDFEKELIKRFFDDIGYDEKKFFDKDEEVDLYDEIKFLYKSKNRVNQIFPDECLVYVEVDDEDSKGYSAIKQEVLYKGSIYHAICECARYFKNRKSENEFYDSVELSYGGQTIYARNLSSLLFKIKSLVNSVPEPMDYSIVPTEYPHFDRNKVDDNDYEVLWHMLQQIEDKYRKGINYEQRYKITEWESELCYEQGKFLEFVEWDGDEPSVLEDIPITYVTYSKMEFNQLRSYLYWRTNFRNGNIISTKEVSYYLMFAYEMLAELGDYSYQNRLNYLEKIWEQMYSKHSFDNSDKVKLIERWIEKYAEFHGIKSKYNFSGISNNSSQVTYYQDDPWSRMVKVHSGEYGNIFEILHSKSSWKVKKNSFVIKSKCLEHVKNVVEAAIPKLSNLFEQNDLVFANFLVGKLKETGKNSIYSSTVWTGNVLKKVGCPVKPTFQTDYSYGEVYITDSEGNTIKQQRINMSGEDPFLAEYILKFIEMLFRQRFEYDFITWPVKLKGAIKVKVGGHTEYVLSTNDEEREKQLIYCRLYDEDIDNILIDTFRGYCVDNADELEPLIDVYKAERETNKIQKVVAATMSIKSPGVDEIGSFIKESSKNTSVQELLSLYEKTTLTTKKSKAKVLSRFIFDYWILHNCEGCTYDALKQTILGNKFFYEEQIAILKKDFQSALPYFYTFWDSTKGVMSKFYTTEILEDCIVVTLSALDSLFEQINVSFTDVVLGKWSRRKWIPFDGKIEFSTSASSLGIVNIGDLETYLIQDDILYVEGYEYTGKTEAFIRSILKGIDNELRVITNTSLLTVDDMKVLSEQEEWNSIAQYIFPLVSECVKRTVNLKQQRVTVEPKHYSVEITSLMGKKCMPMLQLFTCSVDIEKLATEAIIERFGIISSDSAKVEYDPDVVMNPDDVAIDDWFNLDESLPTRVIKQEQMVLTRFYNIRYELQERLEKLIDNYSYTNYDASFNFKLSEVMRSYDGIIGKDLYALSSLQTENTAFLQWVKWVEKGKIIFPKNEPYVQILFHLIINGVLFAESRITGLIVMCTFCNNYLDNKQCNLLVEWTKHYWMVFCPEISYQEYKKLFRQNIEFEGEEEKCNAKEHYLIDISGLDENSNLVRFYNENCDYKVCYGRLVQSGLRSKLEGALHAVHKELEKLWESYERNLIEDVLLENSSCVEKSRALFFRSILLGDTKELIMDSFSHRQINDAVKYRLIFDYEREVIILKYSVTEISQMSGRFLLEYILKKTELRMRRFYNIPGEFKFSEEHLYQYYPYALFEDNLNEFVIEDAINKAVDSVCAR